MAFHVACPITCRQICFCSLGFPRELLSDKAKNEFLEDVARVEEFLKDPWLLRVRDQATVQVAVPKVVAPPPVSAVGHGEVGGGVGDGDEMLLSAQTKRAVMQRKAAAASLVAEDYARRFESGALAVVRLFFVVNWLPIFSVFQVVFLYLRVRNGDCGVCY
ncbi:hypothetical protein U1Q18_048458 [Sarracenia purpurea var. burkii]